MESWRIGLSDWIIADGNYGNFSRGQVADFALEFYAPCGLYQVEKQTPRVQWLKDCRYKIAATVVNVGRVSVLDFGLQAYREGGTSAPNGSTVEGEIYLSIDPFFYFETLFSNPMMPALINRWRIDQILKTSAPLVKGKGPDGKRALIADETRERSEAVVSTNAPDDNSHANLKADRMSWYVLVCKRIDATARRVRELGV